MAAKKVYGYGPARPAQKPAPVPPKIAAKPQLSQRDSYGRAMERARKAGGSNGIGVGM